MPANRTLLCSYLSFTLSELDLFMELLIGWNPYAGWKDLLSEAGISSDCKTWLFDRAYALEFIQVKAGLSLWKPREPSWMMQKNLRKSATKSCHKCHPRIIHSSFASNPWQLCEHWKVLFQHHRWVSLENERKRTKSQWVLQVDTRLIRRGNYQQKL